MLKVRYNAPATLIFTAICFGVLVLDQIYDGVLTKNWFSTVSFWVGYPPYRHIGLLIFPFGHVSFQHFFNNMTLILLLGPGIETRMGSKSLVFAILITNLVIGIVLGLTSNTMGLGASGIAFMFIAVTGLSVSKEDGIPLTFILVTLFYILPEVLGFFGKTFLEHTSATSYGGHLLGFLSGVFIACILRREDYEVAKQKQAELDALSKEAISGEVTHEKVESIGT